MGIEIPESKSNEIQWVILLEEIPHDRIKIIYVLSTLHQRIHSWQP